MSANTSDASRATMMVQLTLPSGLLRVLRLEPGASVRTVKAQVADMLDTSVDWVHVLRAGQRLANDASVFDGEQLYVLIRRPPTPSLRIVTGPWQPIVLERSARLSTVAAVKRALGTHPEFGGALSLYYNGVELPDELSFDTWPVGDIDLVCVWRPPAAGE